MAEMKLIPGYRFHPTDVELVQYFLKRKVLGKKFPFEVIAELEIYKYPPWDLSAHSLLKDGDLEWFFFCPRGKKYASGKRINRGTEGGYWKTTGRDRSIEHKKHVVGMIKTLVFHLGKAPDGKRTDWVMHEYRLEDKDLSDKGIQQDSYVICKLFRKEGPGPRNGAQYGRPFDEKEWDEEGEVGCVEPVPVDARPVAGPIQPTTCHSSVVIDMHPSTSECFGMPSVSCPSGSMPPCSTLPSAQVEDETSTMLTCEEGPNGNNRIEMIDIPAHANNPEELPCVDPHDIFGSLVDLDSMFELEGEDEHGVSFGEYPTNRMLSMGEEWLDYVELEDLEAPLIWPTEEHGSRTQDK